MRHGYITEMDPLAKYKALVPVVHRILLEKWDPIGVNESPEAQDEYDSYIPGVIALLIKDKPASEIAEHLGGIAIDSIGLGRSPTREMEVARALKSAAEALLRDD